MAKDSIDVGQVQGLLNEPLLTPTAIRSLLEEKGIKTQAAADKWAQQNAAPTQGSFWSRGWGGLERSWTKAQASDPVAHLFGHGAVAQDLGLYSPPADPKAAPQTPEQQHHAAQVAKQQAAQRTAALQKQVATSPWTVMGDYLAQQYQQAAGAAQGLMDPYAGGANSKNAEMAGAATQNALALTGLSPSSSAAGWLGQQQAAASAVDAPVAAAMGQEAGVYAKEAGPISAAVQAFGQANALGEITAPEASWLNALATHITSNLSYYGEVPTAALPTFEANPALGTAIQQSGGYGGAGGAGLTPVASVPTLAGTRRNPNATALAGIGTGPGALGTVPTAGGTPSS